MIAIRNTYIYVVIVILLGKQTKQLFKKIDI